MNTTETLKLNAPAALALSPAPGLSTNYSFLPTSVVLDALAQDGWAVADAKQARGRHGAYGTHSKHQVILADAEVVAGNYSWCTETPRIILTNSHNGGAAYKMRAGLFVRACSNGLEVSDGLIQAVSIRHYRHTIEDVVATAHAFRQNAELVGEHVAGFKATELSPAAACEFVRLAIALRHTDSESVVAIEDLLAPQRPEDAGNSLWKTFNRAQEWLLKGGYPVYHRLAGDWGSRKARAIRAIDETAKLNTGLWALAEGFSNN